MRMKTCNHPIYQVCERCRVKRVADHRILPHRRVVSLIYDKRIPKQYRKSIIFHEKVEDKLQRNKGLTYLPAHKIANQREKEKYFKNNKKGWKNELSIVSKIYNRNKRK